MPPLSPYDLTKALRRNILAGSLGTVFGVGTTGAFLVGYALRLGANPFQIGLLTSLPLLSYPIQILASYVAERKKERKKLWFLTAFFHRFLWVVFIFTPLYLIKVSPSSLVGVMLWVLFLSYLLASWGIPLWYSWMADLVPLKIRGRFWGKRQAIINGVGLASSLLLAKFLDLFSKDSTPRGFVGFSFLFLIGVVFGEMDILIHRKIPDPGMGEKEKVSPLLLFKKPFEYPNFRQYLVFISLWNFSIYFMAPFVSVYFLNYLKLSYFSIYFLISLHMGMFIFFSQILGLIIDKVGNKPIMLISLFPISFHPFIYLFVSPDNYIYFLVPLFLTLGIFWAGISIASTNLLLGLSPARERSMFVAVFYSLVGIFASLAPLISGKLVHWAEGISFPFWGHELINLHLIFALSALLRLFSLHFFFRIKEEGALSVGVVAREIAAVRPFRFIPALFFLRSVREERRIEALKALREGGGVFIEEKILSALRDPSRRVREEAARTLEKINERRKALEESGRGKPNKT